MVANRHITKIIIVLMAAAVVLCFLATGFSSRLIQVFGDTGIRMEYESKLFNTDEVIDINIEMEEETWNAMLQNAMSEEYYVCNVVINGLRVNNVAIRPKGNTSLSAIATDPDTDRYSLKLEFDHFVDGQTCYGLDKLILNNNYADATNMKEAVFYDMYQYIGADASLYNYAKISVNGEYWGVYLALEGVEESFMLRNFGTQDGELYKPDSMEMGGGDSDSQTTKDMGGMGELSPGGMGGFSPGGMGGFFMGNGGANLNYTDDELDSYSTIWEGEITATGKADHKRVVTALKNISEGTDLEKYLDVDNILKYMAVHVFAVNMDSLSGSMAHNYYLYEYDGRLNLFPWDYNLSFGGMSMGNNADGTEVVNDAIDTPFSGTGFFDALLSNEEYLAKYHEYLQQLVDEYVNGGRFDETYDRIRNQIDSLVETDPTAFYTDEDYQNAAPILYETIKLRAESIEGQLNGTIPSTDAGQREDSSSLIDASHIDIKAMGQFNMGGSVGNISESESDNTSGPGGFSPGNMPDMGDFDPGNMPNTSGFGPGNMPDMGNFDPGSMSGTEGFSPDNMPNMENQDLAAASDLEGDSSAAADAGSGSDKVSPSSFSGMSDRSSSQVKSKNLITYGVCFLIIIAALAGVILFKRRK